MKLLQSLLMEGFAPNIFFRVEDSFPIYHGGGFTRRFNTAEAQPGDEIHWLKGGTFLVRDGAVVVDGVHVTNPDKYSEGEYHAARNNPDAWKSKHLQALETDGKLTEIPRNNAQTVKYRT